MSLSAPSFLKKHYNIPPSNFSTNNVLYGEYSDILWGDEVGGALFSNFSFENFTEAGEAVTSLDHFVTNANVTDMTFTPAAVPSVCPLGAKFQLTEGDGTVVPVVLEGGPNAAWTNRAEPNGPWQQHWTVVYTGQIYDADGKMSFREHFMDTILLEVGGQVVLDDAAWDTITTSTVDFDYGGSFDFEVRLASGFGGGGIHVSEGIGFEWDRDGGTKWRRPKNRDANTADLFRTCITDNDGDGVCE